MSKRSSSALRVVQDPAPASPEAKYQILFDQASDAIVTIAPHGAIDAVNQAAEELTGWMRSELAGKGVAMLMPDASIHRIPERARPFQSELLEVGGTYEDVAIVRKDGYVRLVDLTIRLIDADGHAFALALFRDVTEKKRMERELITKHAELRNAYFQLEKANAELKSTQEMLVQAGKMAALGELAAGIAHELNQPLTGIRGYAQEMGEQGADAEMCRKEIVSNVDKMSGIIGYLRTFTRKSIENYELVDLHAVIEDALKMLQRQYASRGIAVTRDFAKILPKVYANPLQLEQVFINLAANARDAIEETGRGGGNVWITTRQQGEFVEVVFKDDGAGMNERVKSKAFNPFFTTKEVGRGMGLGLSLSYGMVSKLHGSIVVESELGKGAAFTIRLPRDFREVG